MPVSSTRRKAKPKNGRKVIAKRTNGWAVLTDGRAAINAIMTSVRALATIAVDADKIGLSDENKEIAKGALQHMRRNLVVDAETNETVLMRAEAAYSRALALVDKTPYVKESQLAPEVQIISDMMMHSLGHVLPHLGAMSDVYMEATDMTEYHVALLDQSNAVMQRLAGIKPSTAS